LEPEERATREVEREEGVDLNRRGPSKDGNDEGDATAVDKDSYCTDVIRSSAMVNRN